MKGQTKCNIMVLENFELWTFEKLDCFHIPAHCAPGNIAPFLGTVPKHNLPSLAVSRSHLVKAILFTQGVKVWEMPCLESNDSPVNVSVNDCDVFGCLYICVLDRD